MAAGVGEPIPVAVFGASGKMGRIVSEAVQSDAELSLVARLGRDTPRESADSATVVVDFTHPDSVMGNVEWAIRAGKHVVVGTTGLSSFDVSRLEEQLAGIPAPPGVLLVPNFSISALLARRFAVTAASYFDAAEIIEYYSDTKAESPAGTSREFARAIANARRSESRPPSLGVAGARGIDVQGTPIHAVRMAGFVSRQEVVFGTGGEFLSIRFETLDRQAYAAGVLRAIKGVVRQSGLHQGLDSVID